MNIAIYALSTLGFRNTLIVCISCCQTHHVLGPLSALPGPLCGPPRPRRPLHLGRGRARARPMKGSIAIQPKKGSTARAL